MAHTLRISIYIPNAWTHLGWDFGYAYSLLKDDDYIVRDGGTCEGLSPLETYMFACTQALETARTQGIQSIHIIVDCAQALKKIQGIQPGSKTSKTANLKKDIRSLREAFVTCTSSCVELNAVEREYACNMLAVRPPHACFQK